MRIFVRQPDGSEDWMGSGGIKTWNIFYAYCHIAQTLTIDKPFTKSVQLPFLEGRTLYSRNTSNFDESDLKSKRISPI